MYTIFTPQWNINSAVLLPFSLHITFSIRWSCLATSCIMESHDICIGSDSGTLHSFSPQAIRYCQWRLENMHPHRCFRPQYSRIISTKSPSICMTTFSTSLTYLTVLLPQSHDCSYYVSRRILAPPQFQLLEHTHIQTHTQLCALS